MNPRFLTIAMGAALALGTPAFPETVQGPVTETAFGKIVMKVEGSASLHLALSAKETTYEPELWRPLAGDEIEAEYVSVEGKRGSILKLVHAKALSMGPASQALQGESVEIEVTAVSNRGISGHVVGTDVEVRFLWQKRTEIEPADWRPAPGDRVAVAFTVEPSRMFGLNYRADSLEKIEPSER